MLYVKCCGPFIILTVLGMHGNFWKLPAHAQPDPAASFPPPTKSMANVWAKERKFNVFSLKVLMQGSQPDDCLVSHDAKGMLMLNLFGAVRSLLIGYGHASPPKASRRMDLRLQTSTAARTSQLPSLAAGQLQHITSSM